MTVSHGRKSRARKTSHARGTAYAAANAGTLHHHDSGHSVTDLQPSAPSRWGVAGAPDMRTASAQIGACIVGCAPCWASLAARFLDDEDPIALAVTAGAVCNLRVMQEPNADRPAACPCGPSTSSSSTRVCTQAMHSCWQTPSRECPARTAQRS